MLETASKRIASCSGNKKFAHVHRPQRFPLASLQPRPCEEEYLGGNTVTPVTALLAIVLTVLGLLLLQRGSFVI